MLNPPERTPENDDTPTTFEARDGRIDMEAVILLFDYGIKFVRGRQTGQRRTGVTENQGRKQGRALPGVL